MELRALRKRNQAKKELSSKFDWHIFFDKGLILVKMNEDVLFKLHAYTVMQNFETVDEVEGKLKVTAGSNFFMI